MTTEASRKKAEAVWLKAVRRCYADPLLKQEIVGPEEIAAALDEARAEGAEQERWECHLIACTSAAEAEVDSCFCAEQIAARGPMRGGPEEE